MLLVFLFYLLANCNLLSQEWRPDFYQITQNQQTPQMIHALKEIPKLMLSGDESVLDVGCGDGAISKYIAQNYLPNGSIHGIDISQSMIDKAIQQNSGNNTSFSQASLFDYNPPQDYDTLVCFWTLYLFDNYSKALESVIKTLKPNGKALICHIIEPGTPFFQLFKASIAPQKLPLTLPTLDTVINAIKQVPVSIEYFEIKYNYDRYPNIDSLYSSMKKIPFFNLLNQKKEPQFYKELQSIYKTDPDGYIRDYSQIVCMILKKQ